MLRKLVLTLSVLLPLTSHAEDQYSLAYGAATYHLLFAQDSAKFRNKWSPDGRLIGTPIAIFERRPSDSNDYDSLKWFAGQNSAGGFMAGSAVTSGAMVWGWYMGISIGIYLEDARPFYSRGIASGGLPIDQTNVIQALAGFEIAKHLAGRADIHLIVTPLLALSYVSFSF